MRGYEGLFIFPPEATSEVRKNQLKNLEDLVAKFKGKVIQKTELGKKPLGYPVKKFREGYAVLVDYQMDSLKQNEFRDAVQLQEDIVKFMITIKPAEKKTEQKTQTPAPAPKTAHSPSSGSQTVPSR